MWILLPLLLVITNAHSAFSVGVEATVDKTEASLEDQILLTVTVSGLSGLNQRPELPPLPDFLVSEGGTSSRTEIINGQVNSSVDFAYSLSPKRSGRFTIGPVTLTMKGQTYTSTPVVVTILASEKTSKERSNSFVTQEVDVTTPFVNQQIIYTFRFFTRLQTMEAQLQAPSFQGFWVEDLGKERPYQRVIDGISYSVTEIKKALFPMNPGPAGIEESVLTCKFLAPRKRSRGTDSPFDDSFFSSPFFGMKESVTRTLHSEPIRVKVRPLPDEGRPQDFKGLVGDFRIQATLGQNTLKVGDSTTLTITVQGRGNLRDLPDVSTEGLSNMKIYPDKPSFQMRQSGDFIEGTKVFKKALVPLQEGHMEIPPLMISFFEPNSGTYRMARTDALSFSVLKAPQKEGLHTIEATGPAGQKMAVRSLGEDIVPIHDTISAVSSNAASSASLKIALCMVLAPPLVFFSSLGIKRRKERLAMDRSYARRREAERNARSALAAAKKHMNAEEDREFYRDLSRCIKGFIGDKENLSALAMTPREIEEKLKASGLDSGVSTSVKELLGEFEYCQYVTSQKSLSDREVLFKRTKKVLSQLDKKL